MRICIIFVLLYHIIDSLAYIDNGDLLYEFPDFSDLDKLHMSDNFESFIDIN